jgi:hypothetical protein
MLNVVHLNGHIPGGEGITFLSIYFPSGELRHLFPLQILISVDGVEQDPLEFDPRAWAYSRCLGNEARDAVLQTVAPKIAALYYTLEGGGL